jgi:hypothetical protein
MKDNESENVTALGIRCYEPQDFSTENMTVICNEVKPKFGPEEFMYNSPAGIYIGESDTFILSQLLKLNDLTPPELIAQLSGIEKNMDGQTVKDFLVCRDCIVQYLKSDDNDIADDILRDFILIFLGESIKRAEEKAKCQ